MDIGVPNCCIAGWRVEGRGCVHKYRTSQPVAPVAYCGLYVYYSTFRKLANGALWAHFKVGRKLWISKPGRKSVFICLSIYEFYEWSLYMSPQCGGNNRILVRMFRFAINTCRLAIINRQVDSRFLFVSDLNSLFLPSAQILLQWLEEHRFTSFHVPNYGL